MTDLLGLYRASGADIAEDGRAIMTGPLKVFTIELSVVMAGFTSHWDEEIVVDLRTVDGEMLTLPLSKIHIKEES